MEIDSIIKDLGASAIALRPQESCNCNKINYKPMGFLIILILVLVLASQRTFIYPSIILQSLAIIVSTPFTINKEKRSK